MSGARRIPPAPFDKGVAKVSDINHQIENGPQRGLKKVNINLTYLPYNLNLKPFGRKLRRNMTEPERKMWREILSRDQTGFRFNRQKPLLNFIADFYCSKLLLVVEIDGNQHYTKEGKAYDFQRTRAFEEYGIKVIRYSNKEVMENLEGVYLDLMESLKLRIKELSNTD